MKNAIIAATKYNQKNLPLASTLLKDITCLLPTVRNKDWTIRAIFRLAERFSYVIKERDVSVIKEQWIFYQQEEMPNEQYQDFKRLDFHWSKIFDIKSEVGSKIFELLSKLVEHFFLLYHRNASVERSISDNKNTVTLKRIKLKDSTLSALRKAKEHARACRVLVVSIHLQKVDQKV